MENKGKSFIINKLLGKNFGQGYSFHTQGLCIQFDDDGNNLSTYIDVAGINKQIPIKSYNDDIEVKKIYDNLGIEDFI